MREVRAGTYPAPAVKRGRKQIWLREDLDRVTARPGFETGADVAADL